MEKYYVELSESEQIEVSGGIKNIWEFLGFIWQGHYNMLEANGFAPSVMPYK